MVRAALFAVLLTASATAAGRPLTTFTTPRAALDEPAAPSPFALTDSDAGLPQAKKRGVIAGVDLAPDAAVGFGVFTAAPKPSLSTGDGQLFGSPRQSRKAGVGLSLKF